MKITLLNGSDGAVSLPVSQILSFRIWPAGAENDCQDIQVFMLTRRGHLLEGVGVWHTTSHTYMSLGVLGEGAWESSIRVQMKVVDHIAEVGFDPLAASLPQCYSSSCLGSSFF